MEIQSISPIGIVQKIPEFDNKIKSLLNEWESNFKNWFNKIKPDLKSKTKFLLYSLDQLVMTISVHSIAGPDKKATVLNGLEIIYDYIVKEGLPIWLRPIASQIKVYVIYTLASIIIDWMVNKYKQGNWKTGG